jgi:hypothetical protein
MHTVKRHNQLNGHNLATFTLALLLLTSLIPCQAQDQKRKRSVPSCEPAIAAEMRGKGYHSMEGFKRKFTNPRYKVSEKDSHIEISNKKGPLILSSAGQNISHWNEVIDWKKVKYGYLRHGKQNILVAIAPVAGASGFEVNFFKYLIVDLDNGRFTIDESLSDSPRYFYAGSQGIHFYIFDYSDEWRRKQDLEHITLDIRKFHLPPAGDPTLIRTFFCKWY